MGRNPVPDEFYAAQFREPVATTGDAIPSAREVARLPSVGQDRARRLVAMLSAEQEDTPVFVVGGKLPTGPHADDGC